MPDTYGYFYVECGDADPTSITDLLGIEPSELWRKGAPHPKWQERYRRASTWKLFSPLPRNEYFLEAHLDALVTLLLPVADHIRSLPEGFHRGINCVGYYTRENPGFHLSRELQRKLIKLDLEVDFDEYLICDDEDPWEHIIKYTSE